MTDQPSRIVNMTVGSAEAGTRLDRLLADHLTGVARKRAGELIASGRVRVDGHRYSKSYCPTLGQKIEVRLGDEGDAIAAPDVNLSVLVETPELVVIDKPAGLPSAALPDHARATAAGALLARYPEMAGVGFSPRDPGLVHRLDTFTSGALLAARSARSFDALRRALESGEIDKRYLALVQSAAIDDAGVIDVALAPDPKNRRRVRAVGANDAHAHRCQSSYEVRLRGPTIALVEVRAPSAYRHQIRAHLASRGSPLLGDELYGGPPSGLGERHALHASSLAGSGFAARAPLASDLVQLLLDDGVEVARVLAASGE